MKDPLEFDVYKNGVSKVEAEDFAGNKTITTFTVKDCKPTPIKVDKITVNSEYITGKTVPNAAIILKTSNYSLYVDGIRADKKGYFKVKIAGNGKLSLNQTLICFSTDIHKKYSTGKFESKVVKK